MAFDLVGNKSDDFFSSQRKLKSLAAFSPTHTNQKRD